MTKRTYPSLTIRQMYREKLELRLIARRAPSRSNDVMTDPVGITWSVLWMIAYGRAWPTVQQQRLIEQLFAVPAIELEEENDVRDSATDPTDSRVLQLG